ncbi:type I restriction endonuclease subunit R [Methylomonas koyamae]|uniref:type I restriction endonuclease subunit R n=1 Tax=Methylomonas koyamae TaxID=702114 RepID=UPI000BC35368|nr:HsdR family type I site-specific deoxyribonuclease [Methylomonas koyamae]ATG91858.1 type I restriction enzyme subunit R [Methylomonas koyamae]
MAKPGEHKTVQSRILHYAEQLGWQVVSRSEAEARRGFKDGDKLEERCRGADLFFSELLYAKALEFNPRLPDDLPALLRRFALLSSDIFGNRAALDLIRGHGKFAVNDEKRELDLQLIAFDDIGKPPAQWRNVYEVTEEYSVHNGYYGNRADVVFLINGIPVLVIECKNANKDEAIALGIDQLRRYHEETPEMMVPPQMFTVTEAIGFAYGITWNTVRRNIFNWRGDEVGNLEQKIKSFCQIDTLLGFLQDYIVFAEKDEELNKFILRQHQTRAVEKVLARAHDPSKSRGLIWHTQGSGKTFTMIKAAERLYKAPDSDKPTVLLMIDRNELEDQMVRNLKALGIDAARQAMNIKDLADILKSDYRGIVVTMMHKFRGMPANLNARRNIYVLIDEAHRTTGGDLGTYLMAAIPNATYIGFSGTPIDKAAYGKGTFKTFGIDDQEGYTDKYSIRDSIDDGTTLELYYDLAPNELLVPKEDLEKEFLNLAESEGVSDIEELNKILERAVNTKNFLKGAARVPIVAQYVADHYTQNVEPLGYKAFLVCVDREACELYKDALDKILPSHYSDVIISHNHNDSKGLKRFHYDEKKEKNIRKEFAKFGTYPKILIVTEKLLTGYDAPILYAMYLDKPMRDHTLLQAIARVNRPYENEREELVKPHGFVLDFIGLFDKLEKALAFDSEEVNACVKDIALLKGLFKAKMESKAPVYIQLIQQNFNDKDVDNLIEHFRDKERRKAFFKEYKAIEMLYEIISPDVFLRPYIDDYATVSNIYAVVAKAYAKRVYVDRAFQKKTNALVQAKVSSTQIGESSGIYRLNAQTIELIKSQHEGKNTRVINLVKSIEKNAEEQSDDPFLVTMAERAQQVLDSYESRQESTQKALDKLLELMQENEQRKQAQAEKGFDGMTYFVFCQLLDHGLADVEAVSVKIGEAFVKQPNWLQSEDAYRELRQSIVFALFGVLQDMNEIAAIADELLRLIAKAHKAKR